MFMPRRRAWTIPVFVRMVLFEPWARNCLCAWITTGGISRAPLIVASDNTLKRAVYLCLMTAEAGVLADENLCEEGIR